jgi:HSP20 family protein
MGDMTMALQQELQVQQKREIEKNQESTTPTRAFLPTTDIFETDEALTVVLEMAGVDNEGVEVTVENDILTISGRIDFSKQPEQMRTELPNSN